MEQILEFLKSDIFILILAGMNAMLFIAFIIYAIQVSKIKNEYKNFIKKLGKGNNIEEMLKQYIDKVEEINKTNDTIQKNNKLMRKEIEKCLKKVGVVRYSAFKDTGSDLSFALCLLDDNNNGVVLNGIYSREISNIYAKPVQEGKSTYTLSDEENKAINMAIQNS